MKSWIILSIAEGIGWSIRTWYISGSQCTCSRSDSDYGFCSSIY